MRVGIADYTTGHNMLKQKVCMHSSGMVSSSLLPNLDCIIQLRCSEMLLLSVNGSVKLLISNS